MVKKIFLILLITGLVNKLNCSETVIENIIIPFVKRIETKDQLLISLSKMNNYISANETKTFYFYWTPGNEYVGFYIVLKKEEILLVEYSSSESKCFLLMDEKSPIVFILSSEESIAMFEKFLNVFLLGISTITPEYWPSFKKFLEVKKIIDDLCHLELVKYQYQRKQMQNWNLKKQLR